MFEDASLDPEAFANENGLIISSDTGLVDKVVKEAIAANPKAVADKYLKWCAANGYAPLKLNYDYMLYLPRFEPKTDIYSATAFYHTNKSVRYDCYEEYLKVANSKKDYFKGKAAFSEWDLKKKLSYRWIYFRYEDAESAASELAAEILADAYGLKPRG